MELTEVPIIAKAIEFATLSLSGKRRKSGEDIVVGHCLRVAKNLQHFKVTDPNTLAVAILHHSLHEGAATLIDVRAEFGDDIADMLESFEKLRVIKPREEMGEQFTENLRKMFLVLAKDLRVVLIKLTDILDNLTTLQYVDQEKRKEVAHKTLEIFAPLAERLGMGELRGEMQDLAFCHLYPEENKWVQKVASVPLAKLSKEMSKVKSRLMEALIKEEIDALLQSRIKHIYSLYTKLERPEIKRDISKVYDLMAMRVIVESKEDCYKALGVVNKIFRPFPEKVSDFIAHPKPNGYQSIHIKVYGPDNLPFEVQIRTRQMHEEAEYGVAAHWHYAEQKEKSLSDSKISQGFAASGEKLEWVKRLSQWQEEITDDQEFFKTVKTDFFGQRIFCFTPKGDVKDLPIGATSIDFAYQVHSDMGNLVTGTRVNGKVVSLDTKLKNGDVVELLLAKDLKRKPSRDWLGFVKTTLARRKIKKAYTTV